MKNQRLYPLQFHPIVKDKIWGGDKLKTLLYKDAGTTTGESWELSGVPDNQSIVAYGMLRGKSLHELITIYKSTLLGREVYKKFGSEFPLLIKFIDAHKDLSIQVHPNDQQSNGQGKTEMWYVMQADPDAYLLSGFNQKVDTADLKKAIVEGTFETYMNKVPVKAGDTFFIKANHVHSIGAGVLLAEIQQTSDITYRIYDFNRKDALGNLRALHIDEAFQVMDMSTHTGRVHYTKEHTVTLVTVPEFHTYKHIIHNNVTIAAPSTHFKIIICTKGSGSYEFEGEWHVFSMGETLLIPAGLKISMSSDKTLEVLETFVR